MTTELDNLELRPARRHFLKATAALATTLVAPGILLYQTGQQLEPLLLLFPKLDAPQGFL